VLAAAGRARGHARPSRTSQSPAVLVDLLSLLIAFVVCSALAGLLGATNLGTALTFGVFGFTLVLLWQLLLRRDR
jgi:ABC-type methionine transport system permease subunit